MENCEYENHLIVSIPAVPPSRVHLHSADGDRQVLQLTDDRVRNPLGIALGERKPGTSKGKSSSDAGRQPAGASRPVPQRLATVWQGAAWFTELHRGWSRGVGSCCRCRRGKLCNVTGSHSVGNAISGWLRSPGRQHPARCSFTVEHEPLPAPWPLPAGLRKFALADEQLTVPETLLLDVEHPVVAVVDGTVGGGKTTVRYPSALDASSGTPNERTRRRMHRMG